MASNFRSFRVATAVLREQSTAANWRSVWSVSAREPAPADDDRGDGKAEPRQAEQDDRQIP